MRGEMKLKIALTLVNITPNVCVKTLCLHAPMRGNKIKIMNIINWSGYEWITQERWGQIHPEKPWNWYDPSCVKINERGNLELWVKKNPTVIKVDDVLITELD